MFPIAGLRTAIRLLRWGFRAVIWVLGTLWLGLMTLVRFGLSLRRNFNHGHRHAWPHDGESR